MEKLCTSKTFLKMAGGMMHTPHPGSAPGHKLQKPSKESGVAIAGLSLTVSFNII